MGSRGFGFGLGFHLDQRRYLAQGRNLSDLGNPMLKGQWFKVVLPYLKVQWFFFKGNTTSSHQPFAMGLKGQWLKVLGVLTSA